MNRSTTALFVFAAALANAGAAPGLAQTAPRPAAAADDGALPVAAALLLLLLPWNRDRIGLPIPMQTCRLPSAHTLSVRVTTTSSTSRSGMRTSTSEFLISRDSG